MSKNESIEVATQVQNDKPPVTVVNVLSRYRVEGDGNDAKVYERVYLNENYAGKKGVKKFVTNNGKVTYYAEKLVKTYSQNVVKA